MKIIKISSSAEFLVDSGLLAVEIISCGLLDDFVALVHNNYLIVTIIVDIIYVKLSSHSDGGYGVAELSLAEDDAGGVSF